MLGRELEAKGSNGIHNNNLEFVANFGHEATVDRGFIANLIVFSVMNLIEGTRIYELLGRICMGLSELEPKQIWAWSSEQ